MRPSARSLLAAPAVACFVVVTTACPPEAVGCADNTDCDGGDVCVGGSCVAIDAGEGEVEVGEGEGDVVTGEGEGDIVVGEGEGEVAVCGNAVVEVGEDCDDGDADSDDEFADGCHACAFTAPVVDVVSGRGGVDSLPLLRFVTDAGHGRIAAVTVAGVYLADVDAGVIGSFERVAGAGVVSRSLFDARLRREAARNDLFAAGVFEVADVAVCADGATYLAVPDDHVILRVDDSDADGVVVFAGSGSADDSLDPADFVYAGTDPKTVPLSPVSLSCDDDNELFVATTGGRVLGIDTITGVTRVVLGRRGDFETGSPAQNLLSENPVAVDVVGADLLVALATNNAERVVRVDPAGNLTNVAGGGTTVVSLLNLDTPVDATNARLTSLDDVESDGHGGFWVVFFLRDVFHVDSAGSMRHVGRTLPVAIDPATRFRVAPVGDDVAFAGRGSIVRATAAASASALGAPARFPTFNAFADGDGVVFGPVGSGLFARNSDGSVATLVDGDAIGDVVSFGGVRAAPGVVAATGLIGATVLLYPTAGGAPVKVLDLGETSPAGMAQSTVDPDVVWVATVNCKVFRFDVGATLPAPNTAVMNGCTRTVGTTMATTTLDATRMIVTRGSGAAPKDILTFLDETGRVTVVPESAANDGVPAVIAGTGAGVFSGDGGAATAASFEDPTAIVQRTDGSFVVADGGRLRSFRRGGTITTLAGAEPGFRDGALADARFARVAGLANDGDTALLVVEALGIRRVDFATGTVTTVVGGVVGEAEGRLGLPRHVACKTADSCAVIDEATHSLRSIDVATGAVATLAGDEGDDLGVVGGLSLRSSVNGPEFIFSQTDDDVIARVDALTGAVVPAAQGGGFVLSPGPVAGDSGILFASEGTTLKRVSPNGTLFGGPVGPIVDLDASADRAVLAGLGDGEVYVFASSSVVGDVADARDLQVADGEATSVAVDDDVIVFIDDLGVNVVSLASEPLAPRTVLPDTSGCFSDVELVDDVIFVVDRCRGELVRVSFQ